MSFALGVVLGFVVGEVVTFLLVAFFVGRLAGEPERDFEEEEEQLVQKFLKEIEAFNWLGEEEKP